MGIRKLNNTFLFVGLIILTLFFFLIDLGVGSVSIPISEICKALFRRDIDPVIQSIIIDIRLNKAIVALMCGSALSVSGLQMQTLFRNPLAGPYVLGISSGASLGVALFILGMPLLGISSVLFSIGLAGAAWIGAALILIIISIVSYRLKDIMVVLILGMMFSSGVSAIVQILQYLSDDEALKSYVIWTMGSLGDVQGPELFILVLAVAGGLILAVIAIKPLNQLLLGEEYARTMGLNVRRSRGLLFFSTTLLAGTVTAFCGPIGFIGMAIPHVTRNLFSNSDHRILVPANILTGALILIVCDILSKSFLLPVNAITALLGIPVIIFIVLRNNAFSI
ncbi:MAG: iron ABC transporter permease [Muribaculaceae bacterium]|nr:iron ABC transporter permease [Muribaculaceae bacterium]